MDELGKFGDLTPQNLVLATDFLDLVMGAD
jgi:hypothetical protein